MGGCSGGKEKDFFFFGGMGSAVPTPLIMSLTFFFRLRIGNLFTKFSVCPRRHVHIVYY